MTKKVKKRTVKSTEPNMMEVTEVITEDEWAIKWAEEARARARLEKRLLSMLFDTFGLVQSVHKFIGAVIEGDGKGFTNGFKEVLHNTGDTQLNVHLNFIDFPGRELMSESEIDKCEGLLELEEDTFTRLHAICLKANDETDKDWDKMCDRFGMIRKNDLQKQRNKQIVGTLNELKGKIKRLKGLV